MTPADPKTTTQEPLQCRAAVERGGQKCRCSRKAVCIAQFCTQHVMQAAVEAVAGLGE